MEMVNWVHADERDVSADGVAGSRVLFWITPVMPGDGSGASAVQDAEPMAKIVRAG